MTALTTLYSRLLNDAQAQQHRRLLVVSGTQEWCYEQARELSSENRIEAEWLWVSDHAPAKAQSVRAIQCHQLLGQSLSAVIFDAWSGFNPNAFGQISGTLSGGGVLVLLCPDLDHWAEFDDPEHQSLVAHPYCSSDAGRRFISRLAMILEDDAYTLVYREGQALAGVEAELPSSAALADQPDDNVVLPSKTKDQQQAVELILSQFRRGRRPAVITADRGRGKSVALGIAAAQLSGLDFQDILVTAPEQSSVDEVFSMAHQLLPDYDYQLGKLSHSDHCIRYVTPEQALQEQGEGQVLLVDEAAAIPVPVLSKLLQRFPRIAFASTIHGYEGTGQGFAVRFKQVLEKHAPNAKSLHLNQPIRWASNDPLEQLTFNLLLLNAEPAAAEDLKRTFQSIADCQIEKLDRDQLAEDYQTLTQLFGLLVLAHYRTSPGDLRVLLDSPNLHIWLMKVGGQVAGAALVAKEGPLPEELVDDIWSGKRRPRGHLLPQTLVGQEGAKDAALLKAGRIMRIAIHPALQHKGLGRALLSTVSDSAKSAGWDYLGASFAASAELISFWQHCGFETVRMGSTRDSVSGCHAALVLSPLTEQGQSLEKQLRQRFIEQLNYRLSDDLVDLDLPVVCRLLQHGGYLPELTAHDQSDLVAFAVHNRNYEGCAFAIHKLLLQFLDQVEDKQLEMLLENEEFMLLIERNLQQKSWEQLEVRGQGRKQMMRQLKSITALLLEKVS
ncbi:tRNA(Met) cytidine acetyltransferase TmcA [Neptuniibacter sp. PT34_22]|uniref:tRNA(Met) cytidine acetyltransferase TmcA n=1 Tax=Neptuniibacter sp. PT34_22 TaxID=3398205 RepID=UPI0039F4640A